MWVPQKPAHSFLTEPTANPIICPVSLSPTRTFEKIREKVMHGYQPPLCPLKYHTLSGQKFHEGRHFLYTQHLEQCLGHSRRLINMSQMNESCTQLVLNEQHRPPRLVRRLRELMQVKSLTHSLHSGLPRAEAAHLAVQCW